jgi:hypothetical protein
MQNRYVLLVIPVLLIAFFVGAPDHTKRGTPLPLLSVSAALAATNTFPSSGDVGIGTTSPGTLLDVEGGETHLVYSSFPVSLIERTTTGTTGHGTTGNFVVHNTAGTITDTFGPTVGLQIETNDGVFHPLVDIGAERAGGDDIGDMFFNTYVSGTETERMRIKNNGDVGIGTTNPTDKLVVDGAIFSTASRTVGIANALNLDYSGTDSRMVGNGPNTSTKGSLIFSLSSSDGSVYADAMRITATGTIGMGTDTPAQALEVTGKVQVDTFGSATSTSVCELSGVLSSCSSSMRYKENVKAASFGLKEVLAMRPVTFKWKGRDEQDFGLVAEDVEKINPLFVTYKQERTYEFVKGKSERQAIDGERHLEGVKYPQLTAVLVKAVQEQQAEIATLQHEVAALKAQAGKN